MLCDPFTNVETSMDMLKKHCQMNLKREVQDIK